MRNRKARTKKAAKRKVMTKTVRQRELSARELTAASKSLRRLAAAELTTLLEPALAPGETMPDLALVQELCGRVVEMRRQTLCDADEAHARKTTEHRRRFAERDDALGDLYRELGDLRTVFRGTFGTEEANLFLCISGDTSRDPEALPRQADRAILRLRDRSKALPPAKYPPSDEARASWGDLLARKTKTLRTAHSRTTLAAKELERAAAARQRALDDFNDVFARLAGWLESTYRAAGLDKFADAVHPSGRRKGRLAAEVRRDSQRKTTKKQAAASEPERPKLRLVDDPEPSPARISSQPGLGRGPHLAVERSAVSGERSDSDVPCCSVPV